MIGKQLESLRLSDDEWEFLPFRFYRLENSSVLLTNFVGELEVLSNASFKEFVEKRLADSEILRRLRGKHFVAKKGEALPIQLLAMKFATKHRNLSQFTRLHIFVVSLRCEHTCQYCQVSRQGTSKNEYDMSAETAIRAVEVAFRSPSANLKFEFQGGEPLLNFDAIKLVVETAERINQTEKRNISFVIASNLALLDAEKLEYCKEHEVFISTSLDGPADLHNKNRPRPGQDSWQRTIAGIDAIKQSIGRHGVSALMTTTEASLSRAKEIIDCYVDQDLHEIFLRPISPYGFAVKGNGRRIYETQRWIDFYTEGLEYIIEVNRNGFDITELFAAVILKKMYTNDDPGYVDLTSPAGIGIGAIVYNYDGRVFASDESRMLAEMGDDTFCIGDLARDSYEDLITSDVLLDALEESFALSAPMCNDCAFESFCGCDPVFHHTTSGDFVGKKPLSAFCQRNMAVFNLLIQKAQQDEYTKELFQRWATQ